MSSGVGSGTDGVAGADGAAGAVVLVLGAEPAAGAPPLASPPFAPAPLDPLPAPFFGSGRMSIGDGFAGLPHSAGSLIALISPTTGPDAGLSASWFLIVSQVSPNSARRNG